MTHRHPANTASQENAMPTPTPAATKRVREPTLTERLIARYVDCADNGHRPDLDQPRRLCDPAVRAVTCTCGRVTWTPTEAPE